ncbi:hypothetical protein V8E54_012750 [Elaphomyces granulatus]
MGFWGERVADPFLCAPVTTYSTLYSFPPQAPGSPFYRYYSWYAYTTTAFCMDANMMKAYIPMLTSAQWIFAYRDNAVGRIDGILIIHLSSTPRLFLKLRKAEFIQEKDPRFTIPKGNWGR